MRNFLYSLYGRKLQEGLRKGSLPRHVGVILDGNRRFAHDMGYGDVSEGHRAGARKIDEFLEWCAEMNIPIVTLWLLSTDNFRRDPAEISKLLSIIEAKVVQLTYSPVTYEHQYQIRVLGRLDLLPASTRAAIQEAEERTRQHAGTVVNLAISYGGRDEIIDAVAGAMRDRARLGESLEQVAMSLNSEDVARHLYTANLPDPDLIIRTSGEIRLSGFLLWQSAHSEFYFCDAHWPSFRKIDFLRALRSYQQRQRRFGGDGPPEVTSAAPDDHPLAVLRATHGWRSGSRLSTTSLVVKSLKAPEFIDITDRIEAILKDALVRTGEVRLYCRHTSAGLTINEHEPLLLDDMARFLQRLAPSDGAYAHNDFSVRTVNMTDDESPNGHAHCQKLALNTSEFIPVLDGRLQLGTWQRVFFVELDRAREREVLVQVSGE